MFSVSLTQIIQITTFNGLNILFGCVSLVYFSEKRADEAFPYFRSRLRCSSEFKFHLTHVADRSILIYSWEISPSEAQTSEKMNLCVHCNDIKCPRQPLKSHLDVIIKLWDI